MSIIHDIQNATTCNGMREWTDERVGQAMREYAKAVAEDALKRAADRVPIGVLSDNRKHEARQSILSTEINLDL